MLNIYVIINISIYIGGLTIMPTTTSSKTERMRNEFMGLHKLGYTIPEIAVKTKCSSSLVYQNLGRIAKENGFSSREVFLEKPHKQHEIKCARCIITPSHSVHVEENISPVALIEKANTAIEQCKKLLDSIEQILE